MAEGVETEAQLQLLAAQGCDEIQGYYFSRPLAEAQMVAMLVNGDRLEWTPAGQPPARALAG